MKTLKTQYYAIIFLFIFYNVNSQENYYLIKGQELLRIDDSGNKIKSLKNIGLDLNLYNYHKIKNEDFLLNHQSGIVFKIDNDSLVRYDNSYDDKIHNGSLDFLLRDTLYRFGGYGYYHTHKTLVYLDQKSKQWDLVQFKGYEKIEPFSSIGFHYIKDGLLHVYGYNTLENTFQNVPNLKKKGFTLDLDKKEIIETFNLSKSFEFPDYYINTDRHILLFYKNVREVEIYDIETEKIYNYTLNIDEYGMSKERNQNHLIIQDNLYFLSANIDEEKKIKSISIDQILSNMIEIDKEIKQNNLTSYFIVIIPLTLVLLIIIVFRKSKEIKVIGNKLHYNFKSIELDQKEINLVSLLLKNKVCTGIELNEIFYLEELNPSHINRTKNTSINNINSKFHKSFKLDLILHQKSSIDKRIKEFNINPKIRT